MCFSCKTALEHAEQQKAAAETKLAANVEKKANVDQKIEALDEQAMAREEAAKAAAEIVNQTAAVNEAKAAVAAAQQALQSNSSSPVLTATLNAAKASCLFCLACSAHVHALTLSTTQLQLKHNVLPRCHLVISSDVSFRVTCDPRGASEDLF